MSSGLEWCLEVGAWINPVLQHAGVFVLTVLNLVGIEGKIGTLLLEHYANDVERRINCVDTASKVQTRNALGRAHLPPTTKEVCFRPRARIRLSVC